MNFKGQAKRLDDIDLPLIGRQIGVGEDEIHALLDVESAGAGFDRQGRPKMLFEPHVFWRELGPGAKRDKAAEAGLAYPKWRRNYPADSYPRLIEAMKIDEEAALRSASWGLAQIMGFNARTVGYATAKDMVLAFMEDEEAHLRAMVLFIVKNGLADHLRMHNWKAFARGYNGPGFAKNGYDRKLAQAFARWRKIKDTPVPDGHVRETPVSVTRPAPHVNAEAPKRPAQRAKPAAPPSPAPKINGPVALILLAVAGAAWAIWERLLGLLADAAAWIGNLFN